MKELLPEFERLTAGLRPRRKAMFPSELFLFYWHVLQAECDMILESGTGNGGSAEYLGRLFPGKVISIDRSESQTVAAKGIPGVSFKTGDGRDFLPALAWRKQRRIGVLIDGPKGFSAVRLAASMLMDHPNVQFCGVHDLALDCPDCFQIHSHDPTFRQIAGHLDRGVAPDVLGKHPMGPGLTIFESSRQCLT